MADAKRYFIYARKSTDVEDKQVRSIDAQLSELHEFAQHNGIIITDVVIEKESAKTPGHRKQFNAMLDQIEKGYADGILSWHPDRLARNMTDGGRVIDLIDTGKLTSLRFPSFWFDTTPQGKFMLSMAFSQSKYYVDSLSENTKRGLREKVRRGEYPGRAPFGYLNDGRIKKVIPDPERAPIVKQVFERYATGSVTIESLRHFLTDHGVLSRTGKTVSNTMVTNILTNPIYYGQFRYSGEVYDGMHMPIVSKKLFDEAHTILKQRFRYSPKKNLSASRAFSGILRCAGCGYSITAETHKGYTYYRCTKKGKSAARCLQPYIREEALDAEMTRVLSPYALREDWADDMIAQLAVEEERASTSSAPLVLKKQKQVEGLQLKIGRLLEMRIDGEMDAKTYTDKKAKLVSQKRTLEEEITAIGEGQKPWLEPLKNWILDAKNLREIAQTSSRCDKRGMAKKVFGSNLFLSRKKARGEAVKPWAFLADNELSHDLVRLLDAARKFYQENQSS